VFNTEAGPAPCVDSKLEATFSNQAWLNTSFVDGWTLPYRIYTSEKCRKNFEGKSPKKWQGKDLIVDASGMSLDNCPTAAKVWRPETCDGTDPGSKTPGTAGLNKLAKEWTFAGETVAAGDLAHAPISCILDKLADIKNGTSKSPMKAKTVDLNVKHPKFKVNGKPFVVGCASPQSITAKGQWNLSRFVDDNGKVSPNWDKHSQDMYSYINFGPLAEDRISFWRRRSWGSVCIFVDVRGDSSCSSFTPADQGRTEIYFYPMVRA